MRIASGAGSGSDAAMTERHRLIRHEQRAVRSFITGLRVALFVRTWAVVSVARAVAGDRRVGWLVPGGGIDGMRE